MRRRPIVGCSVLSVAVALLSALLVLAPWSARADSGVTVAGSCTLPLAVLYADGNSEPACAPGTASGTTTITLPAGTYTLTAPLSLTANTVITGAGASSTTITGGKTTQVMSVSSGVTASISGVTITGGLSGVSTTTNDGVNGGGVTNAGSLTLTGVAISANATSPGLTAPAPENCFVDSSGHFDCFPTPGESGFVGGSGGGIYNTGTLTLAGSTVSGNATGTGGSGSVGASGSGADVSGGEAGGAGADGGSGGGIFNSGTLTVTNSTISGNSTGGGGTGAAGTAPTLTNGDGGSGGGGGKGGSGAGIYNTGTFTVSGSTIANNTTGAGGVGGNPSAADGTGTAGTPGSGGNGGFGGGIYTYGATTETLTNVTIASNTTAAGGAPGSGGVSGVGGPGGGIFYDGGSGSLLLLSFLTVADNSAAGMVGGIDDSSGPMTEADSIVASNTSSPNQNCSAGITDSGHNVVFGDNSCPGVNVDPKLGELQDNGGPTPTIGLASGSGAIDEVPLMSCPAATDQRGVTRPQGAACDAGAYEFAPPSVSGTSAVGDSPTDGTVTASINPDASGSATSVTVEYGTSSSYGSTTAPQNLGRGDSPAPFSAEITGLQSATTYHFAIVAVNGDGTTTTGDGTFTTLAPVTSAPAALTAAVSSATDSGSTLSVKVTCAGGTADSVCTGALKLSSRVSTRAKKLVAVTADTKSKPKPKPKPKPKTVITTETVGAGTYKLTSGTSEIVKLALNKTGLELLAARYRLPTTLTMSGTSTSQHTETLSYRVITSPVSFSWKVGRRSTSALELGASKIPAGAKVLVLCHGGGCPFARRSFAVTKGKVSLTPAFKHRALRPGVTVEIEIAHTGDVAEVALFTMRAGQKPTLAKRCLVPGASTPSRCVSD